MYGPSTPFIPLVFPVYCHPMHLSSRVWGFRGVEGLCDLTEASYTQSHGIKVETTQCRNIIPWRKYVSLGTWGVHEGDENTKPCTGAEVFVCKVLTMRPQYGTPAVSCVLTTRPNLGS